MNCNPQAVWWMEVLFSSVCLFTDGFDGLVSLLVVLAIFTEQLIWSSNCFWVDVTYNFFCTPKSKTLVVLFTWDILLINIVARNNSFFLHHITTVGNIILHGTYIFCIIRESNSFLNAKKWLYRVKLDVIQLLFLSN